VLAQSFTMLLVRSIKKFFSGYEQSIIYTLLTKVSGSLRASFSTSLLHGYVTADKGLHSLYDSSLLYRLLQAVFSFFSCALGAVLKVVKRFSEGGLLHRLLTYISSKKYISFSYGLAAFFLLMLVVPHERWNNIYAVGAAFLFFFLYCLKIAAGRAKIPSISSMPLSLIVFALSIVCAIAVSPALMDSIRTALFFFAAILFMLIVWMSAGDEKALKTTVNALIAGLFVMSLFAMVQRVIGVEVDPSLTDLANNEGMPGRVYATVGNPNNFAEIIVMIVPFIYAMFFASRKAKQKLIYGVALAASLIALAMSYSRSGYVAFAIATVVFILIYDWRLLLPLIPIGLLCIPFIPETVINRIFTIGSLEDTSNAYRIYLWDGTGKIIKTYFLSGIGIGTEAFAKVYPFYANPLATKAPHSHMLYMELLLEMGILGVSSFLIYMFTIIRRGFSVVKKGNKTLSCIIAAAISAFCGISFTAGVEYIWFYPRVMFVFFIVAGILLCAVKLSRRK